MTQHSRRFKVLWTLWMSGGGIAAAVVAYSFTRSVGWAVVGLLVSGIVLNAIGQAITQPFAAARRR
jgi:ABC-type Fe3+-siderophore transport system permease subunit